MKIVQIVNNYSRGDGISRVVTDLGKEINKKADFEILYRKSSNGIPKSNLTAKRLGSFETLRKVEDRSIVHSHFGRGLFLSILLRKLKNVKHVHTYHAITSKEYYEHFYRDLIITKILFKLGKIDQFVGISKYTSKELEDFYGIDKSTIIYNGVDTEWFKIDRKAGKRFGIKHNLDPDKIILGYLSRFVPHKNHMFLLKFMKYFGKDFQLLLVGKGDYRKKCEDLVRKNRIKNVKFLGFLPENEIPAFYNALDVYIHPSLWEGYGLPIIEAMSCGKPVVVWKNRIGSELVKKETGILVNDMESLGKKIRNLYQNVNSKNIRNAIETEFIIKLMAKRYLDVYKKLQTQ